MNSASFSLHRSPIVHATPRYIVRKRPFMVFSSSRHSTQQGSNKPFREIPKSEEKKTYLIIKGMFCSARKPVYKNVRMVSECVRCCILRTIFLAFLYLFVNKTAQAGKQSRNRSLLEFYYFTCMEWNSKQLKCKKWRGDDCCRNFI